MPPRSLQLLAACILLAACQPIATPDTTVPPVLTGVVELAETVAPTPTVSPTATAQPLTTCAPLRHFSVDGAQDEPFALVPAWFHERIAPQIAPQVAQDCANMAGCFAAYQLVPVASHEGAIIAALHADYVPPDLITLLEANVVNTLTVHQLARKAATDQLGRFFREVEQFGYIPLVRSFYRSYEDQAMLHEREPTAAAPAGYSMHQSGLAFDLWKATPDFGLDEPLFTPALVALAERHGVVHPLDWDRPHYVALDVVYPGAVAMLRMAEIEPHDNDNVTGFLLGLAEAYEAQLAALDPAACAP